MLQDRSSELEALDEGADSWFQVSSVLGGVIPCQMSRVMSFDFAQTSHTCWS